MQHAMTMITLAIAATAGAAEAAGQLPAFPGAEGYGAVAKGGRGGRVVHVTNLGEVFEVHGLMSKTISESERQRNLHFRGGMMFQLGCHLIDAMVRVLGKADSIQSYPRRLRQDLDNLVDNPLAVFEYLKATATIRVSVTEFDGFKRRQFVVAGTEGTIEIRPLEPPQLTLSVDRPRGRFAKGRHEVKLPPMPGRYDGQLVHLARVARGQCKPEYTAAHDLAVQELVLRASGMPVEG